MGEKEILIQELIEGGYLHTKRIIDAFKKIDRKDFVPAEEIESAYENIPLSIGFGQTISQPLTVAFMLELLDPKPGEKILDIGSGSGWTSALLAYCVGEKGKVYAIERIPQLAEFGKKNIAKYNFIKKKRVEVFCKDGSKGLEEKAPFDKILSGAMAKEVPLAWKKQLKIGGKIVTPLNGSIFLLEKIDKENFKETEFPGFAFVPLIEG